MNKNNNRIEYEMLGCYLIAMQFGKVSFKMFLVQLVSFGHLHTEFSSSKLRLRGTHPHFVFVWTYFWIVQFLWISIAWHPLTLSPSFINDPVTDISLKIFKRMSCSPTNSKESYHKIIHWTRLWSILTKASQRLPLRISDLEFFHQNPLRTSRDDHWDH